MSEIWQIEYSFPYDPIDGSWTRVIYYKGTEDDVMLFMKKEAYELLKTYEAESISWTTFSGDKMITGKMALPGVAA